VALKGILLDTNAYAAFREGLPEAVEIIRHAPFVGLNTVILGELLGGFAAGTREASNREALTVFLGADGVTVFSVDERTSENYGRVYASLRRRGKPIPTNDMWIAATALQHGLAVFTYDPHFKYVEGIAVGSQIADFLF
jgi:predicted nucleic acid-binding protein